MNLARRNVICCCATQVSLPPKDDTLAPGIFGEGTPGPRWYDFTNAPGVEGFDASSCPADITWGGREAFHLFGCERREFWACSWACDCCCPTTCRKSVSSAQRTLCRITSIGLMMSSCWEHHHVALFSSSFYSIFRSFPLLFSCTPVLEASSEHPSQTARSPRSFLPGVSQHDMSIRNFRHTKTDRVSCNHARLGNRTDGCCPSESANRCQPSLIQPSTDLPHSAYAHTCCQWTTRTTPTTPRT